MYDVLNTLVRAFSAVTYIFQATLSPFYTEVQYEPVITQPGGVPQAFNHQTVFLIASLHRLQVVWKGMTCGEQSPKESCLEELQPIFEWLRQ